MSELPPLWGLTCASASQLDEANDAFNEAEIDLDRQVLVTPQPDPVSQDDFGGIVLLYDSEDGNQSRWWNQGQDFIKFNQLLLNFLTSGHIDRLESAKEPWDVLQIDARARINREGVDYLRKAMRDEDCSLAGPGVGTQRIPSACCVYAGEVNIEHDEGFHSTLAHDDWLCAHQRERGAVLVPGVSVLLHEFGVGAEDGHWEEDMEKFRKKWGEGLAKELLDG